jgi:hypothetical protein
MAADRWLTRTADLQPKKLSPWKDAASSCPKTTNPPSKDTLPPPALYTYVISHANDMRILFLSFSLPTDKNKFKFFQRANLNQWNHFF